MDFPDGKATPTTPTTTHFNPDVSLPAGAVFADVRDGTDPLRVVVGPNRGITDSDVKIWTTAIQRTDGRVAQEPEAPEIHIHAIWENGLNSDQARELAAVLLEAAAEVDRWVSE